ncbi:SusC/RagA family TonB-linked outer membrane protein [Sphingobacterium sp. SYP-B4668]|uniref:SusC/RagA family TonB-linked outer membrane protein n=1 Tax=Sphingobacterium sp. SYP-B4668 TaxID=2996035 RepID=UPI0022DD4EB8|nr:SusC/RagA family TonB-linked outer membrane protein [Sphingobacterium sp. SYP-B4668]
MKKNTFRKVGRRMLLPPKSLLIMKLTFILLIGFLTQVSANTFGQNVSLNQTNASLEILIKQLRTQTGYDFLLDSEVLKDAQKFDIQLKNVKLEQALEAIVYNRNLKYSIEGKSVVITKGRPVAIPVVTSPVVQQEISGIVKTADGQPLAGATIKIKNGSQSAMSGPDGKFTIPVKEREVILVVSFVGYVNQEIRASLGTMATIQLIDRESGLEEVVVVGYGSIKKQAVTGAVAQADLKSYDKVPVNNIMETLKGTVAGLNVGEANQAGGVPGFTIRGTNTIAASSSPLIVLDGAIFNGSMADISPSDVESVTVLKDASAAAVYGSRSANGVILIETKKGSSLDGKPKFEINTSYGSISELERLKVYDAKGYIQRLYDILRDNGTTLTFDQTPSFLQEIEKKNYDATSDHQATLPDPYDPFRQRGFNKNTSVSVSQRTDKMSYFLSGNYVDQRGVIVNDQFKHYGLRLNLESKVTDWWTLGVKSYYSYRDYPDGRIYGTGEGGSSPSLFSPYASLYDVDGSYLMYPQSTTSMVNPFLVLPTEAYNRTNNLNGILTSTIRVPWIEGLTYTINYSKTLNMAETGSFYGLHTFSGLAPKGKGSRDYSRSTYTLFDHIIKYNKTFLDVHNIDLTLLHSSQKAQSYGQVSSASGFDNDQLGTYRLSAGAIQNASSSGGENEGIGQMARLTYSYDDRYTLTGTVRRDGYSAFSANHKYGTFGSVGANWNIAREKFMEDTNLFSALALRASYGTNGNQSIAPYSTLSKISNGYYFYQGDANYTYAQYVGSLGNDDLVWESTTGLNGGIDFGILAGRISGSIDGYLTHTNNLAFTLPLPGSSGFSTITANAGEIQNKGLEINLRSLNIESGKFSWSSSASFSLNRNKVTRLLGDKDGDGVEDDIISSNLFIGKSLTTVYGYRVVGMWQQEDVDNGTILAGFKPGHYKLNDVNGDGKITSDADREFLGDSNANFRWSFTNTFSYGKLSLLVYLNSIWGGNNWFINGGNTPWNDGYINRGDLNHPVYDYWTPENTSAEFPRPSYNADAAAKAPKYYDRSFIRLQKMALSYNATEHVKKYGIHGLNVSVSGDNLGTYSPHWIGLDAATGSGLTVSSIPSLRTFTMGLNVTF